MFSMKGNEDEFFYLLDKSLNKEAQDPKKSLIKAAENIDEAAKILDDIGLYSVSDKLLEVLASLK